MKVKNRLVVVVVMLAMGVSLAFPALTLILLMILNCWIRSPRVRRSDRVVKCHDSCLC